MIEEKWKDLALPKEQFDELVRIGSFGGDTEWLKFFALAASNLGEVRMFKKFHTYLKMTFSLGISALNLNYFSQMMFG